MLTKTSSFMKLTVLLGVCLGMAEGLLAQPMLSVTIAGKLGPILGGSGGVVSGELYVRHHGHGRRGTNLRPRHYRNRR